MTEFMLRPLTPDDAVVVARHRAAMFQEMGDLAADAVEPLVSATTEYLHGAIARGEYYGWLALPRGESTIAGGAGVQLRAILPRPNPHGPGILTGQQGIILNVFVEPPFRRQGLARRLVETALAWAQERQLASVVLHASQFGRPLYEQLGFVATNEMRYAAPNKAASR